MSMMSNFPADGRRRRIGFALFAALTVLCVGACAPKPPEAAATRPVGTSERPPTIDRSALTRPVALRAVTAAQFDWRDAVLTRLFRRVVPEGAVEAIVIRVHTVDPIDSTPRASIPAIVLNGTVLKTTRVDPTVGNQLVAVLLEDRKSVV